MTETIVVVGGGTGGTVLANRLAADLADEIDAGEVAVKLVTDDPMHTYKPMFLYVAFGEREVGDAQRPQSELLDDRVDLHVERVVDVDTDAKRIEHLLYISEYKRFQSAPGPRLSNRAFWLDRRYPIVNRWRDPG